MDLSLSGLLFLNNSNVENANSVCIEIKQDQPTSIAVTDSVFQANTAIYATVARITDSKGLTFSNVSVLDNIARSTSAGIIFTPITSENTYFEVTDCAFRNNSAMSSGLLTITETSGNMIVMSTTLAVSIVNCAFEDNSATYSGCSLTLTGLIALTSDSKIAKSKFRNNTCVDGGAAVFGGFVLGALSIEDCGFWDNAGEFGAAVYSSHQGYTSNSTYLRINRCEFLRNAGKSIVYLRGSDMPLMLTSSNKFQANSGSCVSVASGIWVDHGSLYIENEAESGAAFALTEGTRADTVALTARGNKATREGAAVLLSTGVYAQCKNCSFTSNASLGPGGVLIIYQRSHFACSHCEFTENKASEKGSVLSGILSSAEFFDSTFSDNHAAEYAVISLSECSLTISDSDMIRNTARWRSPGIVAVVSNVTIADCFVDDHEGETGGVLFTAVSTIVDVQRCVFEHCNADVGGVFYSMVFSDIMVKDTEFRMCHANEEGSIAQLKGSSLSMSDVLIYNCSTILANGALYVIQSSLSLIDSRMHDLTGGAVMAQTSTVIIRNSSIDRVFAKYGAGVNCVDCFNLDIEQCTFTDTLARFGGAVYAFTAGFMSVSMKTKYTGNTFTRNRAVNGGAVYSNSVDVDMRGNRFIDNSVRSEYFDSDGLLKLGIGGAVYLSNDFTPSVDMAVVGNWFSGNAAETRGGGMFWFDDYPLIAENTMANNSAPYGSDIASFPIRLAVLSDSLQPQPYLHNATIPLVAALTSQPSGQSSPSVLTLALVDHYNNIVSDDDSSTAEILSNDTSVRVDGDTQVVAVKGVFNFTNMLFTAVPGTIQEILISSPGVDLNIKDYTNDPNDYFPAVSVSIELRKCLIGESLQNDACFPCSPGTFSLSPEDPCNSCPSHATCYGNFTMAPDAGYWRPDPLRNLFFACPNPDACLGSPSSLLQVSLTGECAVGYGGNLCSICQHGFSRQGKSNCGKCPSLTSNIVVSALIVILAMSLGAFIIIVAVRGATRPRSELAVLLKIFMNYLQMVVVAASLNLNWPDFVSIFLNGQDTAGSLTEQLFSFDCIMQEMRVKQMYYTKLAGTALMPAGLLLVCLVVWALVSLCARISQILQKMIASLVMIIFVLHPSLTKLMFSMFACQELKPGELWLTSDLSLKCWDRKHVENLLLVAIPSISVWIFGLPTICVALLFRLRKRLADLMVQLKFSFLYKGYHPQWYFWEFVILYRKVAVVCASVFLSTVSIMVQALSVLAVLLISLFLQLQVNPFVTSTFNRLELKSILVSSVTIYSGLFYQTESLSNNYLAFEVKVLLFVAILGANSYFLLNWLKCVLPLVVQVLRRRLFCAKGRYDVHPYHKPKSASEFDSANLSGLSKATRDYHIEEPEVILI